MKIRIISTLVAGIFLAAHDSASAQTLSPPRISNTFPPLEDIRSPDRTITNAETGPVWVLTYNSNGRFLATAGSNNVIHLWDAATGEKGTGELIRSFEGHKNRILGLWFGAESNSMVSVSEDQTVKTWDLSTGNILKSMMVKIPDFLRGPNYHARVAFCPGTNGILAVGSWKEVTLWNYESGKLIKSFSPHTNGILASVAFTSDGKFLVTADYQGAIGTWEVETLAPGPVGKISTESVQSIAVSGSNVVAGFGDGSVRLWKVGDKSPPREFNGHRVAITAVAINAKGTQIASAASDGGGVKVWDVETGKLLCLQEGPPGNVVSVAFNPNGQKMASGNRDGSVRYWTVPLPPIPPDNLERIKAALPAKAVTPKQPRKILVFWRADAILHSGGVPAANAAIELMGKKTGAYETDFSRDFEVFDPKVLAKYDAIVMNSTAHIVIPDYAKKAYLDYVKGGGGVIGIHAAIDMFGNWPEGASVIGATFGNHPWGPGGTWAVKLEEPEHPLLRAFEGKNFKIRDEFYEMWEPYTRADRRVLLSVDYSDPATAGVKTRRTDKDSALAWIKKYDEGQVFYCDFGHIGEPFQNAAVLQFYLDGIQYVLGDLEISPANAAPKTETKP